MLKAKSKVRVRAPKGFFFRVTKDQTWNEGKEIRIELVRKDSNSYIGDIELIKVNSETHFETHSYLHPDYRGKGFGAILYSRAIQWCLNRGYKVRSSRSPSELAKQVWNGKSIRKHFAIRKVASQYSTAWFAYNKNA